MSNFWIKQPALWNGNRSTVKNTKLLYFFDFLVSILVYTVNFEFVVGHAKCKAQNEAWGAPQGDPPYPYTWKTLVSRNDF